MTSGDDVDDDMCDFNDGDVECGEMEALIVVRDKGGHTQCTTSLVPEDDDGEHV